MLVTEKGENGEKKDVLISAHVIGVRQKKDKFEKCCEKTIRFLKIKKTKKLDEHDDRSEWLRGW